MASGQSDASLLPNASKQNFEQAAAALRCWFRADAASRYEACPWYRSGTHKAPLGGEQISCTEISAPPKSRQQRHSLQSSLENRQQRHSQAAAMPAVSSAENSDFGRHSDREAVQQLSFVADASSELISRHSRPDTGWGVHLNDATPPQPRIVCGRTGSQDMEQCACMRKRCATYNNRPCNYSVGT